MAVFWPISTYWVLVTEHDCEVRIPKFQFFWNFARNFLEIWKFPDIGWFGPIWMYWVSFPLSFCHWPQFSTQNFQIPIILQFLLQKFSGNLEILYFYAISMYWASFTIDFCYWSWSCTQNLKFPIFLEILQKFSGNQEIHWNFLSWDNLNIFQFLWIFGRNFLEIWKFPEMGLFGLI